MISIEQFSDKSPEDMPTMDNLTRGDFLKAALGTAAATVLAPYVLPVADAAAQLDSVPHMDRTLNVVYYSGGARGYVQAGHVDSVVLWSPTMVEATSESRQIRRKAWYKLDEDLEHAAEDGCPSYVAVWSNLTERVSDVPTPPPTDKTPEGPWAEFIGVIANRIVERHPGVRGIIVMNEPNLVYCGAPADVAASTAEMLISAGQVLSESGYKGMMLGPATSDGPGSDEFTEQVLGDLAGWESEPPLTFGWAHHTYYDVKRGVHKKAEAVLNMLGGRWPLFFSEGGYEFNTHKIGAREEFAYSGPLRPQEEAQLHNVTAHYDWAKATKEVLMWANYGFQDGEWGGGGFMSGLKRIDGTPHPLGRKWHVDAVASDNQRLMPRKSLIKAGAAAAAAALLGGT